jgi:hypothetical protein
VLGCTLKVLHVWVVKRCCFVTAASTPVPRKERSVLVQMRAASRISLVFLVFGRLLDSQHTRLFDMHCTGADGV